MIIGLHNLNIAVLMQSQPELSLFGNYVNCSISVSFILGKNIE